MLAQVGSISRWISRDACARVRPNATDKVYQTFESTPVVFCKAQGFKTYCRCTARCAMDNRAFGEGARCTSRRSSSDRWSEGGGRLVT